MDQLRGLAVTMVGSAIAFAMALVESLAARPLALLTQMGPPMPAAILGIAGLITAFGGIALQAYDKAIARRKVELDHQFRVYLARRGHAELWRYVRASRDQMLAIRRACEAANLQIPPDIGPPPELPEYDRV